MFGFLRLLGLVFILVLGTSCAGYKSLEKKYQTLASVTLDVKILEANSLKIMGSRCTTCHAGATPSSGHPLPFNTTQLASLGYLVLGEAANSNLYQGIAKDEIPADNPLAAADKETIRQWINGRSDVKDLAPVPFSETQKIMTAKCLSCHATAAGNRGGVNLETLAAVRQYIKPGFPYESSLFDSVLKKRMPQAADPATTKELAVIYNWIVTGGN